MSSRSPIQVPDEIKNEVEGLKDKFHAKTSYEVIERLLKYYHDNEAQKDVDRQKDEEAKRLLRLTTVNIGMELKPKYMEFCEEMGLRESYGVALLLSHYQNSDSISKETMKLYQKMMKG